MMPPEVVRFEEIKESNLKVPGTDMIAAANDQVNNVNYESEGE